MKVCALCASGSKTTTLRGTTTSKHTTNSAKRTKGAISRNRAWLMLRNANLFRSGTSTRRSMKIWGKNLSLKEKDLEMTAHIIKDFMTEFKEDWMASEVWKPVQTRSARTISFSKWGKSWETTRLRRTPFVVWMMRAMTSSSWKTNLLFWRQNMRGCSLKTIALPKKLNLTKKKTNSAALN